MSSSSSSLLFTLKGRQNILSANFYPPIQLDPKYNYAIALIGLRTYNSIANIEDDINNKFYYRDNENNLNVVKIPTGAYEISDIEKFLQTTLAAIDETDCDDGQISLKPNNNTLKCELMSKYVIDFSFADSLADLLGFSNRVLEKNQLHESDLPVNIIRISSIRVECNIAKGSYYDNDQCHTIFEFCPEVEPGYSINIEPSNYIYLPIINTRTIDNITLMLIDQDSYPVNFRGEEIVVRLVLKKDGLSDK